MNQTWVVVGTDNFAYEDYPVSVHESEEDAFGRAKEMQARQKFQSLGPFSANDTYRVCSMPEAMRRCELTAEQIMALVKVLT